MIEGDSTDLNKLVSRVALGDPDAFTSLYLHTITAVLRIIYRTLHDRSQAEEVAQEVYLEIWHTATNFDAERDPLHLIVTIARRRAIDRVRSSQAARQRDHHYATTSTAPDHDEAQERADLLERLTPVAHAITRLPDRHRDVLLLAYLRGLTHSEIAAVLNLPLGTVKTRIRDTLHRLRRQLGNSTHEQSRTRGSPPDTTVKGVP